jgi:hypothetical protein
VAVLINRGLASAPPIARPCKPPMVNSTSGNLTRDSLQYSFTNASVNRPLTGKILSSLVEAFTSFLCFCSRRRRGREHSRQGTMEDDRKVNAPPIQEEEEDEAKRKQEK